MTEGDKATAPAVESGQSYENPYADSTEIAAQVRRQAVERLRTGAKGKSRVIPPGRRCALIAIDALMSKQENIQKFYDALQEKFDTDPVEFYKVIVEPVLPKDAVHTDDVGVSDDKNSGSSTVIVLPSNGRETITVKQDNE